MKSVKLAVGCIIALASFSAQESASAGQIDSAVWVAGSCDQVALQKNGDPVEITSILSGGKVVTRSTFSPQDLQRPGDVFVAYALNYMEDEWYQLGQTRYFELEANHVSFAHPQARFAQQQQLPLTMVATLDFVQGLFFHPDLKPAQSLHIWIGVRGQMQVNPLTGVTGEDDHGVYQVLGRQPDRIMRPDEDSLLGGICSSGGAISGLAGIIP
ncbi:MAG: hypothetical protein AAB074_19190 [Planctomycetota bacterium]